MIQETIQAATTASSPTIHETSNALMTFFYSFFSIFPNHYNLASFMMGVTFAAYYSFWRGRAKLFLFVILYVLAVAAYFAIKYYMQVNHIHW